MRRGDIYYVSYNDKIGCEQGVGRPCMVVSSQMGIDTAPVVQCVYLTTRFKNHSCNVLISSIPRESYAMCNHIYTVDKTRFGDYLGSATTDEMKRVDEALKLVLGLAEDDDKVDVDLRLERDLYKALYEKTLEKVVSLMGV